MIFPLWRFWTYSPIGFVAVVIWNASEITGLPCPFAPTMFGLIVGAKRRRA
jgi:hypothetical protein